MITKIPMRTEQYPKRGKPHIYKSVHGWNVCWIPGTVKETRLQKSFEFVNAKNGD